MNKTWKVLLITQQKGQTNLYTIKYTLFKVMIGIRYDYFFTPYLSDFCLFHCEIWYLIRLWCRMVLIRFLYVYWNRNLQSRIFHYALAGFQHLCNDYLMKGNNLQNPYLVLIYQKVILLCCALCDVRFISYITLSIEINHKKIDI